MTSINDILPPEVLSEVFYHATAKHGALELHSVLLVCRLWYNITLKEPRLWTMISVDDVLLSRLFPMPFEAARRFVRQCVDRSGRLPMHVFIDTTSFYTLANPPYRFRLLGCAASICDKIRAMMDIGHFNGRSSRLETLMLYGISPEERFVCDLMLNGWKFPLPRVELHRIAAQCRTPRIPSLTSVVFVNPIWAFNLPEEALQRDMKIKLLSLQKSWAWFLDDLLAIGIYKGLTILRLLSKPSINDVESNFYTDQPAYGDLSILLPSVNTLSLTGEIPHEVLDALDLPALLAIEIRNHGPRHSMGFIQNTTLHHNVKKLEVLIFGQGTHRWTSELAAVLTGALKLQTLIVSPPMLSYLPQASVTNSMNLVVRQN